jgi:hypothetical protein
MRKILPLPGLELRPLGRPSSIQSLYRLRYPGSAYVYYYIWIHFLLLCKKSLRQQEITFDWSSSYRAPNNLVFVIRPLSMRLSADRLQLIYLLRAIYEDRPFTQFSVLICLCTMAAVAILTWNRASVRSIYLSIYPPTNPPTHLSIYGSTALCSTLPAFLFLDLLHGRSDSLDGDKPIARLLPARTEQHKHRINAHWHPCLKLNSNPRSQWLSGRKQFMP